VGARSTRRLAPAVHAGAVFTSVFALLVILTSARTAHAYPQWQFSSGVARCNVCHFAPGGGGLPTVYGRDADGEELSTFAGEGTFLNGAVTLPSWLAVGADLRGAFAAQDVADPNGSSQAFFPMQADLELRVALPWRFSAYGTGGLRAQSRDNEDLVPTQNYQPISTSRLISREHWLMWQQAAQGWYVRAGRFFAPFGLRLGEHLTYVRRDLGFNQLEESYNLSGGFVGNDWELHLTAFAPDFLRHIGSEETGAAAYYERRLWDAHGSLAVQARLADRTGITRLMGGLVGKGYVDPIKTLFFAEADLVHLMPDGVPGSDQLVALLGASVLPARGWLLTLLGERNQQDLRVSKAAWDGLAGIVGWFPVPHAELQLMGRLQWPEGGTVAKTLFLQVHYFL
jgi:hypothetical protein